MAKSMIIAFFLTIIVVGSNAQNVIPVVQTGHSGKIKCVNWDNTGRYIASADMNNDVVINDVIAGKQFFKVKLPGKGTVTGLQFDKSKLIIANHGQNYVFDMNSLTLEPCNESINIAPDDGGYKLRGATVKKGARSLINKDIYVHFTQVASHPNGELVIAGDEAGWLYFCKPSLNIIKRDRTHRLDITDIDYSDDGKYIAIASADRSISIWSIAELKLEKRLVPRSFNIYGMDAHPDGSRLAFGDELGYTYLLVFENDKITCKGINTHRSRVNDVCFTPNPMCVATAGGDNFASVVDFENNIPLQYFKLQPNTSKLKQTFNIKGIQAKATSTDEDEIFFDENVYSVAVSPDGKQIAYSGGKWGNTNPMLKVSAISNLNLDEPKEKRKKRKMEIGLTQKNNKHIFPQLFFISENEFYGLGESNNEAQRFKLSITGYDEKDNTSVRSGFDDNVRPNNMTVIVSKSKKSMTDDYLVKKDLNSEDEFSCRGYTITRTSRGRSVKFEGHRGYINDVEIIRDKNYLISSAEDAAMIIWNIETGEKIMTVYVVDQGKLVFISPDNYYLAQGDALTGMGFNYNGRVLPAEQFDLKYNRPDIVMDKLGIFKPDVIALYYKAYLKRLSKTGFNVEMLKADMNLPELVIENVTDIQYKTTQPDLKLKLNMSDKMYEIDRMNVWVNDVPLFGTNGLSLIDKHTKNTGTEVNIPLSEGNNVIQVSCMNSIGVESLKDEFVIEREVSKKRQPDIYLVSIAVSDFKESKYNLRYTVNDGKEFIKLFEKRGGNYGHVYVDSFYNASCTRENVLNAKNRLMNSHVDDYVIVHIAGHGLLDDNLDFYFATSDIDFSNPSERGLRYDELEGLLDGIPARNKLFLMDACHSGEIDKGDDFAVEQVIGDNQRGVTVFTPQGNTVPKT
ncbi:MAG TPA: caspase family protein, partial [Bacteroidales bacterium]|nr:caspase family protein [Bacteroidales bacterium]